MIDMKTLVSKWGFLNSFIFSKENLKHGEVFFLLKHYNKLSLNEKAIVINKFVSKKIESNPNYEVFVPCEIVGMDNKKSSVLTKGKYRFVSQCLVSNKGRVINEHKKFSIFKGHKTKSGYMTFNASKCCLRLHRAVACMFVPLPKRHIRKTLSSLTVNHLDTVKTNNDFTNLEWATSVENYRHAIKNNLLNPPSKFRQPSSIPFLCTVKIPGKYFNYRFSFIGKKESNKFGFGNLPRPSHHAEGKLYRGCKIEIVTKEVFDEFYRETLPEELTLAISSYTTKTEESFVMEGINTVTGERVIVRGMKDALSKGFTPGSIHSCANGRLKTHKGYVFRKLTSAHNAKDLNIPFNKRGYY